MTPPSCPRPLLGRRALAVYALLAPVAVALPVAGFVLEPAFVSTTTVKTALPFELLGLTTALLLAATAVAELRPWHRRVGLRQGLPVLVMVATVLTLALLVTNFTTKTPDYSGPEEAAQRLLAGEDPYAAAYAVSAGQKRAFEYTWPPLSAKALAATYRVFEAFGGRARARPDPELLWNGVFYLWSSAQLILVFAAYNLFHRGFRLAGVAEPAASILTAGLMLANEPLLRVLRFNQVNLWVLVAALAALMLAARRPLAAGACLALGIHLKIYPAVFLAPVILARRWRMLAATAAGLALIALVLADFGRDAAIWPRYGSFLLVMDHTPLLRDNSLHALFYHSVRFSGLGAAWPGAYGVAALVARLLGLALIGVFSWRWWRRERSAERALAAPGAAAGAVAVSRWAGHASDGFALMLLLSPLVWEHHYVFAMPAVAWAAARSMSGEEKRPWRVVVAAALILWVPTFDVFPLSYHRLAGLLLLLTTLPVAVSRRRPG